MLAVLTTMLAALHKHQQQLLQKLNHPACHSFDNLPDSIPPNLTTEPNSQLGKLKYISVEKLLVHIHHNNRPQTCMHKSHALSLSRTFSSAIDFSVLLYSGVRLGGMAPYTTLSLLMASGSLAGGV